MAKIKMTGKVVSQEPLMEDIWSMWIQADEVAAQAVPGQFISVFTKDSGRLLPRPISLCEIRRDTVVCGSCTGWRAPEPRSFLTITPGMMWKSWAHWETDFL